VWLERGPEQLVRVVEKHRDKMTDRVYTIAKALALVYAGLLHMCSLDEDVVYKGAEMIVKGYDLCPPYFWGPAIEREYTSPKEIHAARGFEGNVVALSLHMPSPGHARLYVDQVFSHLPEMFQAFYREAE